MTVAANRDQPILNIIMVGKVFFVEDHTKEMLDTNANMYNHHHCFSNKSPGKIIASFVIKAKNSTVLGLVQYFKLSIVFKASSHSSLIIF